MRALSQDLLWYGYCGKKNVKFEVTPTPSDATVTLTASGYAQDGNSIILPIGTKLKVKVSKAPAYYDYDPPAFVVTGPREVVIDPVTGKVYDSSLHVELLDTPRGTLTITPVPAGSNVTLTAPGCTQEGNHITVPLGVSVHCTVFPNDGTNLEPHTEDIEVTKSVQNATIACDANISISPTPSNALATITYNGNTYGASATNGQYVPMPYGTMFTYTVSKTGYDSYTPPTNIQAVESVSIPVTITPTLVGVTIEPTIHNIYTPLAFVQLSTNAEGVAPVSGYGQQTITVPVGSSVTYIVSQQYYDTETNVIDNIQSSVNTSVDLHAATLGVLLFDTDTTWTVPTTDNMKMAIITNGGNGGSVSSAKQIGGTGGGASGNTYVVDINDWEAGDVIGFFFTGSAVVVTKNQVDYGDPYPNGGSGVNSSAASLTFDGTNGGSASYGNGGGGGSGGAKYTVYTYIDKVCAGPSCRDVRKSRINRGAIANGGDGGTNSASGIAGDGSIELQTTPSVGGVGGTGFDTTSFGDAENGGVFGDAQISDSVAGVAGGGGLGAINNQNTILTLIQQGSLTSIALRNLIQGGGGGTGGVYTIRSGLSSSTKVGTPGTGGGGGAWTDGGNGVDGTYGLNETDTVSQSGGAGGHGCVIIWRPSDVVFDWGQGQLGE